MTASSINKLLGPKPVGHWNETRLRGDELSRLLHLLLFAEEDRAALCASFVHAPPDFPVPWSEAPARGTTAPRLFLARPGKKASEARPVRSLLPLNDLLVAVVIRDGAAVAVLADKCPAGDHLFRGGEDDFRILSSDDARALGPLFRKLRRPLGKRGSELLDTWDATSPLPDFFLRASNLFFRSRVQQLLGAQIQAQIREYLARTLPIELEGEPLFLALNRFFRRFLSYDYLELQIPTPGDFWPGRGPGWVWRDTEWTGQLLSVIVRPEKLADYVRDGTPAVIHDVSKVGFLMNPYLLRIMGLKSGILLPLPLRSRMPGWVKLFFERDLSLTDEDISLLKFLSTAVAETLVRSRLYLRTQQLATADGLTGLFNHRFFREQLRKEYQRAKRYENALTLIMVDVDDFKQYNDANGHLAGDQALIVLASLIKQTVRDIDFVARYGGEEFALILPEVDAQGGLIVAEKVRRAVEQETFEGEHRMKSKKVTISAGVCDNALVYGPEEMIELADQALYWVKRHGRNQCRLARKEMNA